MVDQTCPTCGGPVHVRSSDEGTSYYQTAYQSLVERLTSEEAVEAQMRRRVADCHGEQYASLHGFAKFQRERPADTKRLRELAEGDLQAALDSIQTEVDSNG